MVKQRFYDHHRDYEKKNLNKPCGHHFNLKGHSGADMIIIGIEKGSPSQDAMRRKIRESFWINLYQSVDYGANLRS